MTCSLCQFYEPTCERDLQEHYRFGHTREQRVQLYTDTGIAVSAPTPCPSKSSPLTASVPSVLSFLKTSPPVPTNAENLLARIHAYYGTKREEED